MNEQVFIYDTTLRDGTQGEGMALSCSDKIAIAKYLDAFGIAFIEGGWPGSNPKDAEFFRQARDQRWQHAKIVAFGATCRVGMAPEADPSLQSLLRANTEVCTLFGKSAATHVREVLRTTHDENLRLIEASVELLRTESKRVIYDAEHFFDGYKEDPDYAMATLHAAVRGGAETLVLCDTNGGSMPWDIAQVVGRVRAELTVPLGIHTHDDAGCGVANALAAVQAGVRQVQGTIAGVGERCGNCNLCALIPGVELKLGLKCLPEGKLQGLGELARFFAETANLSLQASMPYVGQSAFAHKGGVHVAASRRHPDAYQHIDPAAVGNHSRVVISDLSGRGNVQSRAEALHINLDPAAQLRVLKRIKESEARGYSYEAADASVAMLIRREQSDYTPPFTVTEYQATVGNRSGDVMFCEGTMKVRSGAKVYHTVSSGNGPVSALDQALRQALDTDFPQLRHMHLRDYKVRILEASAGTKAMIRVLVEMHAGSHSWRTVGASTNIITASMFALVDAIEYGIDLDGAAATTTQAYHLNQD